MFDCVETLGVGSRPHFDMSSQSSCMLRKTSSFFAAPEQFCFSSTGLQCKSHSLSFNFSSALMSDLWSRLTAEPAHTYFFYKKHTLYRISISLAYRELGTVVWCSWVPVPLANNQNPPEPWDWRLLPHKHISPYCKKTFWSLFNVFIIIGSSAIKPSLWMCHYYRNHKNGPVENP